MSKKKDQKDAIAQFLGIYGVIAAPFILISCVISYFVYKHHAREYDVTNHKAVIRVSDRTAGLVEGWIILMSIAGIVLGYSLFHIGGSIYRFFIVDQNPAYLFGCVYFLPLLAIGIFLSTRMGPRQIGMLVLPKRGIFVIPADSARNTFSENLFQGKYFTDMYKMEELPLSDIQKVTLEKGKHLYVHGEFGTRRISWADKQKRDECVTTLERACGRRLTGYYGGY